MGPAPGTVAADGASYWDSDGWGWQPLWLSVDDIKRAATERFGAEADSPHYFASGVLNQSWRVGDIVVRVSRRERTPDQIRYEHDVLKRLHDRVPEVLTPLAGIDGRSLQSAGGRWLSAFTYVEGVLGQEISTPDRLGQTAEFMARVHRASVELVNLPQRPGFSGADDRSQWLWPQLAPMLRRDVDGADAYFDLFDEETRLLEKWFDRLDAAHIDLPRAVVQVDTNPRNMIFNGSQLVAVIDWDECRIDPLHAAVAREAFQPEVDPVQFWRTYVQAGGPLEADSSALMSGFARLNAFIDLMWADHDGHANPYSMNLIRATADAIEQMRARAPLEPNPDPAS